MVKTQPTTGTLRSGRPWTVLLVLLLAVLVPTACVLWFMTAAMRNDRLAVRQKLTDAYRDRAVEAREKLEAYWSEQAAALSAVEPLPAPQAFARVVTSGLADSAVIYGKSGAQAYPTGGPVSGGPEEPNSPQWLQAGRLEHDSSQPDQAAEVYAEIADACEDVNVKAQALRARARCLSKAGRKAEALEILAGPLAAEAFATARDGDGRLVAPDAWLFALELMDDPDARESRGLAERLAERLNDYAGPPMPSGQRRFLMGALQERPATRRAPPTLAAEALAADYAAAAWGRPEPLTLSAAGPGGLWRFPSAGGTIVALFGAETLLADLRARAGIDQAFAGMRIELAPPQAAAARREPFLAVAAGPHMPGWRLHVHLQDGDPFSAAAARQRAAYLWTGALGIAIIALLGLVAGGYLSRQMRLARLKNDLIATVSHELKTPLASMRVLVDTLLAGRCRDQPQAQEYLRLVARENERLSRLIDNFLAFSRMERNRRAFEFAELEIEDVVAAAVDAVRERFDRPGCELSVEVAADLPPIRGDRDALVTVLLNLLDNAYKYTEDSKRVAVRAYAAGAELCVEVADNGIGMSRRAARKSFDRFFQADQRLSRTADGCGLGLSIVKFIVDAHGGSIAVASQPQAGSTFTVKLPIPDGTARDAPADSQHGTDE